MQQHRPHVVALCLALALALVGLPGLARSQEAPGQWARVVDVFAPHMLHVQDDDGDTYAVWHIGVIGASPDDDAFTQGTQAQAAVLPPGTRIWLVSETDVIDPDPGLRLRHVFLADDLTTPVGAALLRAGWVWVYPTSRHAYTELYADAQAEAVMARTGAWSGTPSDTVFLPAGATSGGLPTSRRLLPALRALDLDPVGHSVLVYVNQFPVEVGVRSMDPDELAYFDSRLYSVQLSTANMGAEPQSIATILIHELTHVQQLIRANVEGVPTDCYASEIEAANAAATYWESLYGPAGKPRLTDPVDAVINQLLRDYLAGTLPAKLELKYREQCS